MKTVRYAEVPDQPWRNGGGVTRELFRDERWRLSVATIAAPGAFSVFPGLDRVFVVARGVVELTVSGRLHRMGEGELLRFAGEDEVSAVPHGEVVAVNVMVTRPLRARVRVVGGDETRSSEPVAVVDLATLDAAVRVAADGEGAVGWDAVGWDAVGTGAVPVGAAGAVGSSRAGGVGSGAGSSWLSGWCSGAFGATGPVVVVEEIA